MLILLQEPSLRSFNPNQSYQSSRSGPVKGVVLLIIIASIIRSVVLEKRKTDNELKSSAPGRHVQTCVCTRATEGGEKGNPIRGVAVHSNESGINDEGGINENVT